MAGPTNPQDPDARGAVKTLDEASWTAILNAFKDHGPNFAKVAKATGRSYNTIKKAWNVGIHPHADMPMRRVVEGTGPVGKAAALKALADYAGVPPPGAAPPPPGKPLGPVVPPELEQLTEAQVRAVVARIAAVRGEELALLDELRRNAVALEVNLGKLADPMSRLMDQVAKKVDAIAKAAEEKPEDLDLKEALRLVKDWVFLSRFRVIATKGALEAERVVLADLLKYLAAPKGEDATAAEGEETSDEELAAELEQMGEQGHAMAARLRARAGGSGDEEEGDDGDEPPAGGEDAEDDAAEPTPIVRHHVASSNLAAVGYDAARRVLEVEFRSGAVYQYLDVPPEEHEALRKASSPGRYLALRIKGRFACTPVVPGAEGDEELDEDDGGDEGGAG